jgi:hypothetical protein
MFYTVCSGASTVHIKFDINRNKGALTLGVSGSMVESRNTMLAIKDLNLVAMKILY